jgi:hypothetical protein
MKSIILSALILLFSTSAFSQSNPVCCNTQKKYVSELGFVFPGKTQVIKDYVNANSVSINPLTSGFGSGFQLGKHRIINDQATLGVVLGANAFFISSNAKTQIYQIGTYLTGRLYFGETWRNGVFTELGAGPEFAASSINDSDFNVQANFASRIGIGYNYQFNKDVTLGASLIVSPSLMTDDYLNGSKFVINMLW